MNVFHLSPQGRDTAPGSSQRPWATLAGARDQLRRLRAAGKVIGPATVQVHTGRYALTETVAFTPLDSLTHYTAAPRAQPVFDGGEILTGWKVGQRNGRTEWTLDLPDVAAARWYFRSLFVDGRRAPRARLPKFAPDEQAARHVFHIGEIQHPENGDLFAGSDTFKPRPGDVQDWASLADAEFVLLHYWIEERLPRPLLNPRTGWLRFARRSAFNLYEAFAAAYGNRALARY